MQTLDKSSLRSLDGSDRKQFTVMLSSRQADRLKQLASQEDRSQASLIRRALERLFAESESGL